MNPPRIFFRTSDQGIAGHLFDKRNGIERKKMFFSRTSNVDLRDYAAIREGVVRILRETGRRIEVKDFGNFNNNGGAYGSADWYRQAALTQKNTGKGAQVSATRLDELLRGEPWQEQNPHFDVMVVDKDMTPRGVGDGYSYVYGYGPFPNIIISTKRFITWFPNDAQRHACLAVIAAHEFGHNLGLVKRNFNVGNVDLQAGHCAGEKGPCLMEQVNFSGCRSVNEQARVLAPVDTQKNWLCSDCHETIAQTRRFLQFRGVLW